MYPREKATGITGRFCRPVTTSGSIHLRPERLKTSARTETLFPYGGERYAWLVRLADLLGRSGISASLASPIFQSLVRRRVVNPFFILKDRHSYQQIAPQFLSGFS